mmetsp:Transcript_14189/g.21226  ORF Transcript_14189/g.21226 Transcript_14189/m.21226 type:complete len:114 (-) Transcript_14189:3750-4091(-)
MHPLVRDLYKRAVFVGKDHPNGIEFVRQAWKKAIRERTIAYQDGQDPVQAEKELRKAVGKGRYAIREMIGVIQFKKFRTMKRRYGDRGYQVDANEEAERIKNACKDFDSVPKK